MAQDTRIKVHSPRVRASDTMGKQRDAHRLAQQTFGSRVEKYKAVVQIITIVIEQAK